MLNNTSTLNATTQSNAYDFSEFTKLKKESKDHSPEALKQVAKQFEALFLNNILKSCLLYTSPSPRDAHESRMPSSA